MVEATHFHQFVSVVDSKYTPVARSTVASRIPSEVELKKAAFSLHLEKADFVSVTVDIWSNRKMHSFMDITVYTIICELGKDSYLESFLLACVRITGSHTDDNICVEFNKVIEEYHLQYKVQSIVNDNAANTRKAFSTKFLEQTTDDEDNLTTGLAGNVIALTASADDDEIDKAEL